MTFDTTASMAPEAAKIEDRHWLDADGTVRLRVSTFASMWAPTDPANDPYRGGHRRSTAQSARWRSRVRPPMRSSRAPA